VCGKRTYLSRKDDHLMLTLEHRAAQPPDPIALQLVSRTDGSATYHGLSINPLCKCLKTGNGQNQGERARIAAMPSRVC
jgi:hypothetical protein